MAAIGAAEARRLCRRCADFSHFGGFRRGASTYLLCTRNIPCNAPEPLIDASWCCEPQLYA